MKPTSEVLEKAFDIPGTTIKDVSKVFNVNEKTIRRWLKSYNLSCRPISENASLRQAVSSEIDDEGLEILYGELLGDGCITTRYVLSARYTHTSKHEKYLMWLRYKLSNSGIVFSEKSIFDATNLKPNENGKIYKHYILASKTQFQLKRVRDLFYPNGIKIVPNGLKLTPKMCLHWYLGDVHKPKRAKRVYLYPYYFHIKSVEYLKLQLEYHKPKIHYLAKIMGNNENYGHGISLDYSFLEYIGGCPEEIRDVYGYKFND